MQKDLSPELSINTSNESGRGEARNLVKAFIGAGKVPSKDHAKLLDNPVFAGCYPKIVDKVFSLERFATEMPRPRLMSPTGKNSKSAGKKEASERNDPYNAYIPSGFTSFEHSLIFVNITLVIGIFLTLILLGLFFLFLNSALYLKEEIS